MLQYRVFIKDCLDLVNLPVANEICTAFSIKRDLMGNATSTFTVLNKSGNIKEGDILGLIDPYGTILYTGVIKSIGEDIECTQMLSLFDDNWKWYDPTATTIEGKIQDIIQTDFINSTDVLVRQKFPFDITVTSQTEGTFEQHTQTKTEEGEQVEYTSQRYVQNLEDFLYELYDTWNVIVDIQVPFGAERPTITIGQPTSESVKVGNNVLPILNMTPFTEVFEKNRLFIYDKDGAELRAVYYGTKEGITQDASNPLRLPVINSYYVFSSDAVIEDVVSEHLQEQMLNHKITFSLLLDNNLYSFFDWQLGMPFEIWWNTQYFSTIFTAYSINKDINQEMEIVDITCGKVRNTLTAIFNRK